MKSHLLPFTITIITQYLHSFTIKNSIKQETNVIPISLLVIFIIHDQKTLTPVLLTSGIQTQTIDY